MKLVLLSDIHLTSKRPIARRDNIERTGIGKFNYILKWANENGADICIAGDFFDKSREWNMLLRMVVLLRTYNVKIYCVYGQHDSYYYSNMLNNATTLGVLWSMGLVEMLKPTIPCRIGTDGHLYGSSWGEDLPTDIDDSKTNILITHRPVAQKEIFPGHKFIGSGRFLRTNKKFKLILVGDIHRHFYIERRGRHIVNTGPMLRLEATDYNKKHKPCFYVYETVTNEIHKEIIPHVPGDEVLDFSHLQTAQQNLVDEQKLIALAKAMQGSRSPGAKRIDIPKMLNKLNVTKRVKKIVMEIHHAARH
jgi:DNA repair exonuclease SbcCD nuclease subunit